MSKHTPGPWQYRTIDGSIGGIDDAKGSPVGQSFAVLIEGKRNIPAIFKANRERIANAMLMAGAPELLRVAKDALALIERILQDKEWGAIEEYADDLRAVIEKAEMPE